MSWIFIEHAAPGVSPWVWEWGSPDSQKGSRTCGCLCCEECQCHKPRTSKPAGHTLTPLAGERHREVKPTAETAQIHRPTFMSAAPYPRAQIQHSQAGDDIVKPVQAARIKTGDAFNFKYGRAEVKDMC